MILGYFFAKPPDQIRKYNLEKAKANKELAEIKSIQLELVRHSLLTRKVIKIDKDIEKLQEKLIPRAKKVKQFFRILRVSLYFILLIHQLFNFINLFS